MDPESRKTANPRYPYFIKSSPVSSLHHYSKLIPQNRSLIFSQLKMGQTIIKLIMNATIMAKVYWICLGIHGIAATFSHVSQVANHGLHAPKVYAPSFGPKFVPVKHGSVLFKFTIPAGGMPSLDTSIHHQMRVKPNAMSDNHQGPTWEYQYGGEEWMNNDDKVTEDVPSNPLIMALPVKGPKEEAGKELDNGGEMVDKVPSNPSSLALPVEGAKEEEAVKENTGKLGEINRKNQDFIVRVANPMDSTQLYGMFFVHQPRYKQLVPKTHMKPSAGFKHVQQIMRDLDKGIGSGADHTNVLVAVQVIGEHAQFEAGIQAYLMYHQGLNNGIMYSVEDKQTLFIDDIYTSSAYQKKGIGMGLLEALALAEGITRLEMAVPGDDVAMEKMLQKLGAVEKLEQEAIWELSKDKFKDLIDHSRTHIRDPEMHLHAEIYGIGNSDQPIKEFEKHEAGIYSIKVKNSKTKTLVANAQFESQPYKTWTLQHVWLKWMYSDPEIRKPAIMAILAKLAEQYKGNDINGIRWVINSTSTKMANYEEYFAELGFTKSKDHLAVCHISPEHGHKEAIPKPECTDEECMLDNQ